MAKPRLVKVRALFYVLQQVMNGREKRVHQNFDTPSRRFIEMQRDALSVANICMKSCLRVG